MDDVSTTVPAMDSSFEIPCGVPDSLKFLPEMCSEREFQAKMKELDDKRLNVLFSIRKLLIRSIQSVNKDADLRNAGLNNCNVLLLDIKEAFEILADHLNRASSAEEDLVQALKSIIEYNDLFLAMITIEHFSLEVFKIRLDFISMQLSNPSSADEDLIDALGSLNSSIKLILAAQGTQNSLIVEIQEASSTIFEKLPINYSAVQELVDVLKSRDASINQISQEIAQKTFLVEMNALIESILSEQISLETRLSNLDITG